MTMKRTYQPNTRKRAKCHGFRARMSTKGGRAVLSARRAKGQRASACNQGFWVGDIKSNTEISSLFTHGKRLHTPYLTFIVVRNEKQHDPSGRAAFIAGKKLGNAVWRNSAKRRMRAVCRELGGPWRGYDVIFLAKSNIVRASYSKVLAACDDTLKRAGVR